MGLDMYLDARRYISNYTHDPEGQKLAAAVFAALGVKDPNAYANTGITVELRAGYWRKANSVHQWFVNNVQDGEDDCKDYYVTREQLQALALQCQRIIDKVDGPDELPPTDGFFFGSTEVDEYYFEDLEQTVEIIDKALANPDFEKADFYYHSSW